MKKILSSLFVSLILLAGCGGGGGSSTGGGGGTSVLSGNYIGTVSYTITGLGGTVSASEPAVVTVTANGQVIASLFDSSTNVTCTGTSPVFLNGNNFNYTSSYSCFIPGIGTCSFIESGQGTINGNVLTASATGTASCPGGTVAISLAFTGSKQGTTSVQPATTGSSELGDNFAKAIGN